MSNTENNPLQNNQINDVASEFEKLLTPNEEQAEETEIEATDIPETETETVRRRRRSFRSRSRRR